MKKSRFQVFGIIVLLLLLNTGCTEKTEAGTGKLDSEKENISTETGKETAHEQNPAYDGKAIVFSEKEVFVTNRRFFSEDILIEIVCPENAKVYYTTDGSEPTTNAKEYTKSIELKAAKGSFPNCLLLKAIAYYADGTKSEVVTHTFFAHKDIETRFETLVFSVSGEPKELTGKPNGIFYDENVHERGRESEREIYVEAMDARGVLLFEQGAGVRPYGGASRDASIKSMKLFARKEYDAEHGKFEISAFQTIGANGEIMDKYDKLVLRNYGNDFQFAFVRDELNQRLAAKAGYTDSEAVLPVVVYLNGEYYGLHYLHENFCNDFFKDKYGDGEGHYEVLEGNEQYKKVDEDDEENAAAAEEFNNTYHKLAYSDLTKEDNYKQLCAFMDVDNYLQFYAYNIYINNNDWPQNNYKCYRYYAGEGESYKEGAQDGRWRFLFHDMDYSMGLYGQKETDASYNNLANIFDKRDESYSPLFVNLMKREDCKRYFLSEIERLMEGVLSAENVSRTLDEMNAERQQEMVYFFEHLESMKETDDSIWIWYEEYQKRTENVKKFAEKRKDYIQKFLKKELR